MCVEDHGIRVRLRNCNGAYEARDAAHRKIWLCSLRLERQYGGCLREILEGIAAELEWGETLIELQASSTGAVQPGYLLQVCSAEGIDWHSRSLVSITLGLLR